MADETNPFDDLPKRDARHIIEEKAETAFQNRLTENGRFMLQRADRKDYGIDCQIEVLDGDRATNARVHVQLKGTERKLNADGSLSVEVSRPNLNYLLMQPHSAYVAYHLPTDTLRICPADLVMRQYEHAGTSWAYQKTVTVTFTEALTSDRLDRLAALAGSASRTMRNSRLQQGRSTAAEIPSLLRRTVPHVHVPDDPGSARALLEQLYERNADDVISAAFEQFEAVLGPGSPLLGLAYMSEINNGLSGRVIDTARVEAGVAHFQGELDHGRYQRGSLLYTIGNGFSALGQEDAARANYEAALDDRDVADRPELAAQIHKNLGSSLDQLGETALAVDHYREALRLDPHLPEAHYALAQVHIHQGDWADALAHLDRAVFTDAARTKTAGVIGWRANVLFNMGEGEAAFRELNSLLADTDVEPWIWPHCGRLVATFGRTTTANARHALGFWTRYVRALPGHAAARRELLLATFYLRIQGEDIGLSYTKFSAEFDRQISHVTDLQDAAFLWDRLGHWAQDKEDWAEAERCFRIAYTLDGGHYGYCLGTALNFLDRHEESLPLLKEQAETLQPDAMSWFQLGVAYANLGHSVAAADAYSKALALDPDYALAAFNLGGVHWNSGDMLDAIEVWEDAIAQFPDHELAAKLQRDFPTFFLPLNG